MKRYSDKRLQLFRKELESRRDELHAAFHKNYHKSTKDFYGLKNAALVEAVTKVFPKKPKLDKDELIALGLELWSSSWFEEQAAGLMLIERCDEELTQKDLPMLKQITEECEGWAMLDYLATRHLGTLAMNYPDEVYPKVRKWAKSKHLWTRRASTLIHIMPSRKKQLHAEFAIPTFKELLHEKEFFIRKAIGWTLREIGKHYPDLTFEFLREQKAEASGLTMREGGRNLPITMRKQLGLK